MGSAKKTNRPLTVLDLFCGAGGFSEGFRSAGFEIVSGIDSWAPAIQTFNFNFGLKTIPVDITKFADEQKLIEELPDTSVIIGSPPCVSFSYSNRLGGADKTEGLRLIKAFFAIVALKKHKKDSKLIAWYMENVANAKKFLPASYSFAELGLGEWAKANGYKPRTLAIDLAENAMVLNAADFGVPQNRKRLFVYEITRRAATLHGVELSEQLSRLPHVTLGEIRKSFPPTNCKPSSRVVCDPLNPSVAVPLEELTDHFYETGAYQAHWQESRLLKESHPYMGRMGFPESENKPSRTIVANPFPRSREAIIYKSEWNRVGDGEYRGPTIREAAVLMSFPITYQFAGSEASKWKLVGNAVCPLVSRALAVQLLTVLGRSASRGRSTESSKSLSLPNLNTFGPRSYDSPPVRRKLARFRSHPFKRASMTVALANYDLITNSAADGRWRCFVTYGIGKGYRVQAVAVEAIDRIGEALQKYSHSGANFVRRITNGFAESIPAGDLLQELYESNRASDGQMLGPHQLLRATRDLIFDSIGKDMRVRLSPSILIKDAIPLSQLYALYAVSHIARTAEIKRSGS